MRTLISLFFIFSFCVASAQKNPLYYYTTASERYFTDTEIDSIFYKTAAEVFEENRIPENLFEKKYPKFKQVLTALSRNDILQSFKWVESTGGAGIKAPKGSPKYSDNKELYKKYLVKNIRKAFDNKVLQMYFLFSSSDRITKFRSIVRPAASGKLTVQEIITIYNGDGSRTNTYGTDDPEELEEAGGNNNEIKRGIVRAFPLVYENDYHLFQNTTFKVKEVLKNGQRENYHTEKKDNGIRLFTGSEHIMLENGVYTYSITYETEHQLKLLKDYDELYWNVTGTGWSFKIDSAICTVILPKSSMPLSSKCYTGAQGDSGENCIMEQQVIGDSIYITFKTSRSLLPYQGLTIATSWPKGWIQKPSLVSTAWYFFWSNKAVFFLPFAALFSFIFCFIFWFRYGVDKKRGNIYPQYTPPAGFSPAALGFIYRQKFSRQLTAATIVDAAVRNVIKIDVEREGWLIKHNEYNIRRAEKTKKPPVSRYEDFEDDIQRLTGTVIKKGKYNSGLGKLNTAVQAYCDTHYKSRDGIVRDGKGFFSLNRSYTFLPKFVCMVATIWGFIGGVVPALTQRNFWQAAIFAAGLILCIIILKIFSRLLPSYNAKGRHLMDELEGFRMFLSTADVQRFDAMAPPKKTLELYEKYLPFAIALGCDVAWGNQFKDIIDTAYMDEAAGAAGAYASSFSRDSHDFTSSFTSSFSGAISSASTPPSSSSGSSGGSFGGGSSGGGGGGGGGGGW